jgi:hypothetical protein
MTARRSSGSSRANNAVEPTRSQNITVNWRRSASAGADASETAALTAAVGAERSDGVQQLAPVADRCNANLPEILRCQLRQHLPIDLVVAEGRHIALKAQSVQPRLYVHAVILSS